MPTRAASGIEDSGRPVVIEFSLDEIDFTDGARSERQTVLSIAVIVEQLLIPLLHRTSDGYHVAQCTLTLPSLEFLCTKIQRSRIMNQGQRNRPGAGNPD